MKQINIAIKIIGILKRNNNYMLRDELVKQIGEFYDNENRNDIYISVVKSLEDFQIIEKHCNGAKIRLKRFGIVLSAPIILSLIAISLSILTLILQLT